MLRLLDEGNRIFDLEAGDYAIEVKENGLAFQTKNAWGADYRNDLFVTEWGSLFGNPSGHKVVRVELNAQPAWVRADPGRLVDWQQGSEIINLTRLLYDFGAVTEDYVGAGAQEKFVRNDLGIGRVFAECWNKVV
mgnify:CR=1 FL=1